MSEKAKPLPTVDLAPRYIERQQIWQMLKDDQKQKKNWQNVAGHYAAILPISVENPTLRKRLYHGSKNVEVLQGTEILLSQLIDKLLEKKRGIGPVIALDIGAEAGVSWEKLALAYANDVDAGNLVFVATGLFYNPNEHVSSLRIQRRDRDFLLQTPSRVHHIQTDAASLGSAEIITINGPILLQRNVDLAHEHLSVSMWSMTPETDVVTIAGLLSPYGIYATGNTHPARTYGPWKDYYADRVAGLSNAHKYLTDVMSLQKVKEIEEGSFAGSALFGTIFKASEAPRISLEL